MKFFFSCLILLISTDAFAALQSEQKSPRETQAQNRQISHNLQERPVILPVKDRDPNPSTSLRFNVSRIEFDGLNEYPELGITIAAINALVEKSLSEAVTKATPGSTGFTPQELEQLGRFLSGMNIHDRQTPLTTEESGALLEFVSAQKKSRGVSVVQLEQVAVEVTNFYRSHGLPLGTAFLPAQVVDKGVVKLRVLEGKLGSVVVSGAEHYGEELIQKPFFDSLGQIVRKQQIESALYLLNDLPGLDARGTFTAGEAIGETRLDLTVLRDDRFSGSLQIDNQGDDATGNHRIVLLQNWFNPSGAGDQVGLGVLQSLNPTNSTSGFMDYKVPLGSLNKKLHARVSKGVFDWQELLDGDTWVASLGMSRVLRRSRTRSLLFDLSLSGHALNLENRNNQVLEDQDVLFGSGKLVMNRVFDRLRLEWDGEISLDAGSIRKGRLAGQKDQFWRAGVETTAWKLIELPGFANPQKLSLILDGQFASGALPATLQQPLGGAHRVRAFDVSTYSADRGIYAGLEYSIMPSKPAGRWLLFADAAYGEQEAFGGLDDSWAYLASVGLGWDYSPGKHIHSSVRASVPVSNESSGFDLTNDGLTIYWNIQYRY